MPFKKKSEETFCVRDGYTKSAKAISFIQCKQSIKTVVLSEKLTNIERLNHVALVEETGGIRLIFMATFLSTRLDIALYKTHTHIFALNI